MMLEGRWRIESGGNGWAGLGAKIRGGDRKAQDWSNGTEGSWNPPSSCGSGIVRTRVMSCPDPKHREDRSESWRVRDVCNPRDDGLSNDASASSCWEAIGPKDSEDKSEYSCEGRAAQETPRELEGLLSVQLHSALTGFR